MTEKPRKGQKNDHKSRDPKAAFSLAKPVTAFGPDWLTREAIFKVQTILAFVGAFISARSDHDTRSGYTDRPRGHICTGCSGASTMLETLQ